MAAKKITLLFMTFCFVLFLAVGAASGQQSLSGKVVETMDSGGYTYVLVDNGGAQTWAAMPVTKVSVGQQVTLQPGVMMSDFTSRTLNRTFDTIMFCGGLAQ